MLVRSNHLHLIPRAAGGYVAYHTIFGNLTILNESAASLLSLFAKPVEPSDLGSIAQQYSPYLQSFYNMYYLVEPDLDERAELELSFEERAKRLQHGDYIGGVQLSVSDACNFACMYCFCDFVDARGEQRRQLSQNSKKLMSLETAVQTIDTLIDTVKRSGKNSLVVKFFGREPLINWKLIEQVLEHYKHESSGVAIAYAMTTNGSLVTPEIAEVLGRYRVRTTVSIDGLEDSNDKVRLSKKPEQNTFQLINKGIEILREHRALSVLSAVITERNFQQFDTRFVDYARRLDVPEIQVLLGMQGDFISRIDPEAVAQKLSDIHAYGRRVGVAVTGYWHNAINEVLSCRKLRSEPRMTRGVLESCTATGHQLSIEPSGDVFPCRAMSTHLGHISDLPAVLESPTYEHVLMRTYSNVKSCHDCTVEGFCQGECLGNLEEKFKDIYKVDTAYCDIYKRVYEKVLATF